MAKFFVTGGTGFLGSSLMELLSKEGHSVVALVRRPERADVLPASVVQVAGDLTSEAAMVAGMAGCDGVFHLAASVGGTIEATREFNTEGTRRVLRAAKVAARRGWLELPLPVNLGVSAKMARQRTRIPTTAPAARETVMGLQAGRARR